MLCGPGQVAPPLWVPVPPDFYRREVKIRSSQKFFPAWISSSFAILIHSSEIFKKCLMFVLFPYDRGEHPVTCHQLAWCACAHGEELHSAVMFLTENTFLVCKTGLLQLAFEVSSVVWPQEGHTCLALSAHRNFPLHLFFPRVSLGLSPGTWCLPRLLQGLSTRVRAAEERRQFRSRTFMIPELSGSME